MDRRGNIRVAPQNRWSWVVPRRFRDQFWLWNPRPCPVVHRRFQNSGFVRFHPL